MVRTSLEQKETANLSSQKEFPGGVGPAELLWESVYDACYTSLGTTGTSKISGESSKRGGNKRKQRETLCIRRSSQ